MKMKKLIALLLALVMVLGLAACGSKAPWPLAAAPILLKLPRLMLPLLTLPLLPRLP